MFLSRLCLFALVVTYCGAADVKDQNRLTRIRRMFNDFEQEERIIHPTRAEGNGPGFTSVRPPVTIPLSHVRYQGTELTTVDVSVGTPAQHFNLTLDYFFSKPYLLEAGYSEKPCGNMHVRRRAFEPKSSSTFTNSTNGWFFAFMRSPYAVPNECGNNSARAFFDGDLGMMDMVKFGSGVAVNASLALVNETKGVSGLWPSDGILGLAVSCGEKGKVCQVPDFLKGFRDTVISIFFKSPPRKATYIEAGGSMVLGGRDEVNCAKSWTYPPVDHNDTEWNVLVNSVSAGTYKSAVVNATALVSNAESIYVPKTVFEGIVKAVAAEYDFKTDRYLIDCSVLQPRRLPDIVFGLGGELYRVTKNAYTLKADTSSTRCPLLVEDASKVFDDGTWVLGMPFLRSYCHSLEYVGGSYRVGFAEAKGNK